MRIAAAQIACVPGDVSGNLRKLRDFAQRAHAAGAEWVVFPEMSDTGYTMKAIRESASSWDRGAVPELRSTARELSLGIVCGVSEREGECIFNSQVVIDRGGEIVARYRKTHLFKVTPIQEHTVCSAGAELTAIDAGDLRFGLTICYDLRFPELYRALAIDAGANVFVISSAWPFPRLEHLRTLATARAIENQSYVVLSNRVGTDGQAPFCGSSCVVDPYGAVIAAASADREELVIADLSAATIHAVRSAMPVFEHRRTDVYRTSPRQD